MKISNISSVRAASVLAALVVSTGALIVSCGSSSSPPGSGVTGGSAGTSNPSSNGNGGSGVGAGGTASTGGSNGGGLGGSTSTGQGGGTGTGGTGVSGVGGSVGVGGTTVTPPPGDGGAVAVQKLCAQKTVAMNPVITDFETYTGMTDIAQYVFPFGGATAGTGTAYGGPYGFSGGTTNYVLSFVAGHTGNWGVDFTLTNESVWGGGMGFWLNCVNASAFKGVSFWARGMTQSGVLSVALATEDTSLPDAVNPAAGGTCVGTDLTCVTPSAANIPITLDWAPVTLPWAMFLGGLRAGALYVPTGDNVVGVTITSALNYVPNPVVGALPAYVPVPGNLTFQVDEVSFIP